MIITVSEVSKEGIPLNIANAIRTEQATVICRATEYITRQIMPEHAVTDTGIRVFFSIDANPIVHNGQVLEGRRRHFTKNCPSGAV